MENQMKKTAGMERKSEEPGYKNEIDNEDGSLKSDQTKEIYKRKGNRK